MIGNPIIRKEVLSALRTRKAVLIQAAFLAVSAGLFWLLWPADGLQDIGGQRAREIFSILAIGQLVMVMLSAPAFTASALTLEREQNTLECLYTTALRPWEIAVGKMVGSLAFLLLLVVTGLPALALPMVLGGIGGAEVLVVVGILVLSAVYLGMIGLLISTLMRRSYRAIIVAYAVVAAVCFLAALPAWPVSRNLITRAGPTGQKLLHLIASLSPLQAMISRVWPGSDYAVGAKGMWPFWVVFLPLAVAAVAGIAAVCLVKLHSVAAPLARGTGKEVIERGLSARNLMFLVDPRKRKRMISWWQNPVLMKEFRTRPTLHAQWLIRMVCIALIVAVLLMLVVGVSVGVFVAEEMGMIPAMATTVAVLMIVLILLLGPAMAGGAICGDRESGVWDQLRATRLSGWRIVSGKYQACIIPMALLTVAMAPALAVLLYFDMGLLPNLIRVAAVAGMTILFVSTAGMFFSSIFSKSSTATAWTYGLFITLGLSTLTVLLGKDLFSRRLVETVFVLNPVAAVMDAAGSPTMQSYGVLAPHLKAVAVASAGMFLGTVIRTVQLLRAD